jgi:hypothetical protein
MESENFAFFENEYQKCQIPTFCEVSQVAPSDDQLVGPPELKSMKRFRIL